MIVVVGVCVCTLSWRGCWEGYRGATTRVGGGRGSEVSRWETDRTPFGCRRRRCGKRRRQLEATAQSSAWGGRQRLGTADGGGRRRSTLAAGVVVCRRLLCCRRRRAEIMFPALPVRPSFFPPPFSPPFPLFFCDIPPQKMRS